MLFIWLLKSQDSKVQHKFAIKNWHFLNLFKDYEICLCTSACIRAKLRARFVIQNFKLLPQHKTCHIIQFDSIPWHILVHIGIAWRKKNFHLVEATDFDVEIVFSAKKINVQKNETKTYFCSSRNQFWSDACIFQKYSVNLHAYFHDFFSHSIFLPKKQQKMRRLEVIIPRRLQRLADTGLCNQESDASIWFAAGVEQQICADD